MIDLFALHKPTYPDTAQNEMPTRVCVWPVRFQCQTFALATPEQHLQTSLNIVFYRVQFQGL